MRSGPSSMIPVDPFDRRARPDPYPVYQYMRTVEPIHKSPLGFWILTRYADCRQVLEDRRWSHDADRILEPARGPDEPTDPTVRLLRSSILFSHPPQPLRWSSTCSNGSTRLPWGRALYTIWLRCPGRYVRGA